MLATQRLASSRLIGATLASPEAVVDWFGAVQAQDVTGATWGVVLRTAGATAEDVGKALDAGTILRTHVLRPTWHLVRPADLRWMQALTAPRVRMQLAPYDRRLEIDAALLAQSHALIADAVSGDRHRTRAELADVLALGGIEARGQRLAHVLMHAEVDALLCSGALRGRHPTYALVDERTPAVPEISRDEALVRLAHRYFQSHGPATPHDFAWWSGLTVRDARRAVDALGLDAVGFEHGGIAMWRLADAPDVALPVPCMHLLPNYDEHVVAYRDHGPSLDPGAPHALAGWGNGSTSHQLARDGLVVGRWKRTLHRDRVEVRASSDVPLSDAEQSALHAEAERYSRFVGLPVALDVEGQ